MITTFIMFTNYAVLLNFPFIKKKTFSALFNRIIINVFWAANQIIRIISEGLCDWSNDAKKSALIVPNKLFNCSRKWISSYFEW